MYFTTDAGTRINALDVDSYHYVHIGNGNILYFMRKYLVIPHY